MKRTRTSGEIDIRLEHCKMCFVPVPVGARKSCLRWELLLRGVLWVIDGGTMTYVRYSDTIETNDPVEMRRFKKSSMSWPMAAKSRPMARGKEPSSARRRLFFPRQEVFTPEGQGSNEREPSFCTARVWPKTAVGFRRPNLRRWPVSEVVKWRP